MHRYSSFTTAALKTKRRVYEHDLFDCLRDGADDAAEIVATCIDEIDEVLFARDHGYWPVWRSVPTEKSRY